MKSDGFPASPIVPGQKRCEGSFERGRTRVAAEMKARQSAKIRELGDALVAAGFLTLDEQAKALGLSRSTAWTVLKGNHKGSGLSAAIVNRMLMSPQLPPLARTKIVEYVEEKAAGLHGHNKAQLRRFTARISSELPETAFVRRTTGSCPEV